eukprot:SAG22_NODE_932_length_6448_cov_7.053709_4_plen_81_part_00
MISFRSKVILVTGTVIGSACVPRLCHSYQSHLRSYGANESQYTVADVPIMKFILFVGGGGIALEAFGSESDSEASASGAS